MTVVVALALVAAGASYGYLRYQLGRVHRVSIPTLQTSGAGGDPAGGSVRSTPASGPFNVLLVGEDSQGGGQRADTMIVARVDPRTGRAALLSVPYDYFGPIVGASGPNKISDALVNGPADMVATVEQDLGIHIQHYIQINFQGVASMVNALGGVRLHFPYPTRDTMSGLSVPHAGCVRLDGKQALALVRSRFFSYDKGGVWQYDPSGAFGRIKRQQAFLRAAVRRVQGSLLGNPLRLNRFISTAVKDVTVDKGLGVGTLLQLARAFRGLGSSSLATFTLPTQIVNNDGQYGDVLYPVAHLDDATIAKWDAAVTAGSAAGTANAAGASAHHTGTSAASGSAASGSSSSGTPTSTSSTTTGSKGVVVPGAPQAPLGSIVQDRTAASYDPTPC
ncbi:MAG TPA: LCP family protein [Acidimicrobiales bacterium]|nr:LCP family protein [Acidimicrobiales bacterium]